MREKLVIRDVAAASLLSRPRVQGLIASLIDQDCTAKHLAARYGLSYSLLSHYLGRMTALGLIRVASRLARAGRASPCYRAVARSYIIPAALCRDLPGELLERELRAALQQMRRPEGLLLWSEGGPRISLILDQPQPDSTELWVRLRLSSASARQLNAEFSALIERWRDQQSPSGAQYLVHAAFAKSKGR